MDGVADAGGERVVGGLPWQTLERLREMRRRILLSLRFYHNRVPGFENVRLLTFASQLGVRESRLIRGLYRLTSDDLLAGRRFDDGVGMAGTGPEGSAGRYHIPYRALVPRGVDGLLVAGRCLSVDHRSQQYARLIPPAMVTGQAAGTAAAIAAGSAIEPRELDPTLLRRELLAGGVLLQ